MKTAARGSQEETVKVQLRVETGQDTLFQMLCFLTSVFVGAEKWAGTHDYSGAGRHRVRGCADVAGSLITQGHSREDI